MCVIEHESSEITGVYAVWELPMNKRFLERVRRGVLIGSDIFSFTSTIKCLIINVIMCFEHNAHDPNQFFLF